MKRIYLFLSCLVTCGLAAFFASNLRQDAMIAVHAAPPAPAACNFPTSPSGSSDSLAWKLFVAANCPTGNAAAPLVWETWPTQDQVFQLSSTATEQDVKALGAAVSATRQRFHASVLGNAIHPATAPRPLALAPGDCGTTPTTAVNPYVGSQRNRTTCEEVRMNPAAALYVLQNGLYTAAGQSAFVKAGKVFQFPWNAVEVKADWEQNCAATTPALHTEVISGVTYCLIAMHMDSKLLPDWLWATFETLNQTENPARCYAIGCNDSFGFAPAVVPNGYGSLAVRNSQVMTASLSSLETSAGLEPALRSYTMDGSQTAFTVGGKPTLLGNSVTEAEMAGVPLNAASCITCHRTSVVNTALQQNLGPLSMSMVGTPPAIPGYAPRDFLWTFIIANGYANIP